MNAYAFKTKPIYSNEWQTVYFYSAARGYNSYLSALKAGLESVWIGPRKIIVE